MTVVTIQGHLRQLIHISTKIQNVESPNFWYESIESKLLAAEWGLVQHKTVDLGQGQASSRKFNFLINGQFSP